MQLPGSCTLSAGRTAVRASGCGSIPSERHLAAHLAAKLAVLAVVIHRWKTEADFATEDVTAETSTQKIIMSQFKPTYAQLG